MSLAIWDASKWDQSTWQGHRAPPGWPGWADNWRVWYQVGPAVVAELTAKAVELRWTSDSHTFADGTFRGDIQPGKCSIRFWDPDHQLEGLDKMGAVWASYIPTGATWCWFYDQLTRAVVAPGDPNGADVVFSGVTWPARITSLQPATYPLQSAQARMIAVVAAINAAGLGLPALSSNIAAQSQTIAAPATAQSDPFALYPSHLDTVRAAATNGVAWLGAGRSMTGPGVLALNYAKWETIAATRALDNSQVLAGPPASEAFGFMITQAGFAAVKGDTGVKTSTYLTSTDTPKYGYQGPLTIRLLGNVDRNGGGPEAPGAYATVNLIMSVHDDPTLPYLSTVSPQSGTRWTAAGQPSAASWDPAAHVWAPTEQLSYTPPGGRPGQHLPGM